MSADRPSNQRPTSITQDELFQLFVENVPAAVAMFDREMRYLVASAKYEEFYRVQRDRLVGRLHAEVFPDSSERWRDGWVRCLAGAVEQARDDPFPRPDGTLDYVDWELRPWKNAAGEIGGLTLHIQAVTEKHLASEALARSEARYRTLFERAPIGMLELNAADGRIARVNERLTKLVGVTPFALQGRPLAELVVEAQRPVFQDDLAALQTHPTIRVERELQLSLPGGRTALVSLSLTGAEPGDELIATVDDLTKRRAAEMRARTSEQRWSRTIHAAPIAIVVAALADGRLLDVNPAFERLYGWSRDEILGRTSLELGMFADPAQRQAVARGVMEKGHHESYGVRIRRKDGGERVVDGQSVSVSMDGEACLVSLLNDVTRENVAEKNLRLREERVRVAFERAPVGIAFSIPGQTRWVEVNDYLCNLLGYTREELLARNILEVTHPDDRAQDSSLADALNRGALHEVHRVKRYLRKDGRAVECALHLVVLPHVEGEPVRSVTVITDVSEMRRAEAAAREAEARWTAVIEALPLGVSIARLSDMRLVDATPAFERLTGYTRGELLGKTANEGGSPTTRRSARSSSKRCAPTDAPLQRCAAGRRTARNASRTSPRRRPPSPVSPAS